MGDERSDLPNCWEIMKCGREEGGKNQVSMGTCPAFPEHGHSCWMIAGTYCRGEVQGTFAKKQRLCMICEVYKLYSTSFGEKREQLKNECPGEFAFCANFLKRHRDAK